MAKKQANKKVENEAVAANTATKETATPKAPKKTRADKINEAVAGKTFTLKSPNIVREEFTCICGGKGKNAYVVVDNEGNEVKVGSTCLKHVGLEVPRKPRKATTGKKSGKAKPAKADAIANEVPIDGAEPYADLLTDAGVDDEFDFLNDEI